MLPVELNKWLEELEYSPSPKTKYLVSPSFSLSTLFGGALVASEDIFLASSVFSIPLPDFLSSLEVPLAS